MEISTYLYNIYRERERDTWLTPCIVLVTTGVSRRAQVTIGDASAQQSSLGNSSGDCA